MDLSFHKRATRALRDFYLGAPNHPGIVARVLRVFFNALSTENQLWLARDVAISLTGACLAAKDRWGEAGNVVIDGNEIRVGVGAREGFKVLGRGNTWAAAFADADASGR